MNRRPELNRREFLGTGVKGALSLAAASSGLAISSPRGVLGANDRVRVAVCGVKGRGLDHLKFAAQTPNVEIAALCDVDENIWRMRLADLEKMNVPKPSLYYPDVRKLLDDKSIDAISIATPNHWHSLIGIWACQAGKDVYVEKPCSHNWWEGRQLVRAGQKYNRIVQHGTQSRSAPSAREAIQQIQDGLIGDVYLARGLCFKWRDTIGHAPTAPVPAGVHYDLWTGPAPVRPFTENRFHYKWHWFWDYGNGDVGNQGVHQLDIARWGLGVKFPNKVSAIGGHFMFDDDQETPNTLNCAFQYDMPGGKRKMIEFEVRHWITNREAGIGSVEMGGDVGDHNTYGDILYGSKGYLAIGNEDSGNPYRTWLEKTQTPGPSRGPEEGHHFANFIDCVRSRRKEDLHAPIEEGHISCTLMHLANASYRLGRTLNFDPETEQVIGDDEANRLLRDGDRGYRAPFTVPEEV
ncbi:MAG: Gfo/Idh/MocA family oxidoreductase [Acidobacteriota bacterium]|nr:Gfo/Idh/MocA family oxidoreductase [Acidobacteriota bacterium]